MLAAFHEVEPFLFFGDEFIVETFSLNHCKLRFVLHINLIPSEPGLNQDDGLLSFMVSEPVERPDVLNGSQLVVDVDRYEEHLRKPGYDVPHLVEFSLLI